MPTYEYECRECGRRFEEFQSITAKPLKTCPKCKGRVKRLLGAGAGFLFKGSGFYQTDYRSKNYRDAAKQDTDKSSPKDDKKTASSPAKEATKETKSKTRNPKQE
jgi:putative FmdB family regulatory protein